MAEEEDPKRLRLNQVKPTAQGEHFAEVDAEKTAAAEKSAAGAAADLEAMAPFLLHPYFFLY